MLAFIFKAAPNNNNSIPDGIFPKRQVVGTAVTTVTAGTTVTSSILATTTTMSSSSVAQITSSTTSVTTPTTTSSTITTSDPPVVQSTTTSPIATPSSTRTTTQSTVAPPVSSTTPRAASSTTTVSPTSSTTDSLSSTSSGSDVVVVGSSTINRSALSSAMTITSALIGSTTEAVESTSFWTSNGQVYSTVYTSNRVVSSTTGFATATIDPILASNGPSSGSSLSPQSQAIIGGVVGGVGGAILLGGLAFAAWRIRNKKQREKLPQDDYYDGKYGTLPNEENTNGLERYNTNGGMTANPASTINPSSNF